MKKITLALSAIAALGLSACAGAGMGAGAVPGFLYTETKVPLFDTTTSTTSDAGTKSGTAMCKSILGWVAMGDCSVETAKKAGGISKISNVQVDVKNILGVYAEYTLKVVGQ